MSIAPAISETAALLALAGVFGLCVGSFLNVLIHRLPRDLLDGTPGTQTTGILTGRSRCPVCRHRIRWRDNIPLLGWIRRRGRCRDCRAPISPRYPLVEALMALGGIVVAARFGMTAAGLSAFLLTAWLLVLAGIDQATRLLPDNLTLSGLWLGLVLASANIHVNASQAILGAAIGYAALSSLNLGFRILRGQDGMGGGDFKLLAMLGAWLGPGALPVVMLMAAGGGMLGSLLTGPARGRPMPTHIAFGPWLAMAGWIRLVWPHEWWTL